MSKLIEVHFIFKVNEDKCLYLTKQKTWSEDKNQVMLMSEKQASDTCVDYDANCGSCQVTIVD